MSAQYSSQVCRELEEKFQSANILREFRRGRYETPHELSVELEGVFPAGRAKARLALDKFIGGGFAGQVYTAHVSELDVIEGSFPDIEIGRKMAVKIIVPPSNFSLGFRNLMYGAAYQGPFSAQLVHSAVRAGALWQKMIRRGAKVRFGSAQCVKDAYATFWEPGLGSYGEVNEWVEGRNWKYEVDEQVSARRKIDVNEFPPDVSGTASKEYICKRAFMRNLVSLFHDMGAHELARQYEWWTCKSQPNVFKRYGSDETPWAGLTAMDFRAGLALLPFLPMSPGDFKLIIDGLRRGNLVQFDRGDIGQLEAFCSRHADDFADMQPAIEELKRVDAEYRRTLPDVTHHGFRLLTDASLKSDVTNGLAEAWRNEGLIDDERAADMKTTGRFVLLFVLLAMLPKVGSFIRKLIGSKKYRQHVWQCLWGREYFPRYLMAREAETLIKWHRSGRTGEERTRWLMSHPAAFWPQILIAWLPAKWHRFFVEPKYAYERIRETVRFPFRLYFDNAFRMKWFTDQIDEGEKDGMLSTQEAAEIRERVADPYIQKYIKCLAVHVCTLPVTQVVSVIIALWYLLVRRESWAQGMATALGILAVFQMLPVSPGSTCRGTYVLYLMIKERNWRNYWVAALVSFWHYIGYLGFPIQMVTKYPALARFMAGSWATKMVGILPVFGESGALPEHWVFDMFFNLPLSLRRAIFGRKARKSAETPRAAN
ncbi:MAG TPA: hypothetical protein PL033_03415 [Candidatus Brocadiia bacterium]|nr:hypothetical protein [Candidatus Brocadiia bacterium]